MEKPKSNKTKIIIIVIAVIIVLAALAIVLPLSLRKKSKLNTDKRILNYYPEYYNYNFYSIVDKSNYFQILEKHQVICFRSPCNPLTNYKKEIKDKEEIKNLTTLFDQVFNNSIQEKKIKENELIDEQKEIINSIFKKNGIIIERIKYEILSNISDYDSKYSKRGYYIEKINNSDSVIVVIAMGIKKSEGYSIKIKNVEIEIEAKTNFAKINIEESSPGDEQIVTNATISYPCTKIKFSKNMHHLYIINEETDEMFNEVEDILI